MGSTPKYGIRWPEQVEGNDVSDDMHTMALDVEAALQVSTRVVAAVFTASGTWTKPVGALAVIIDVISAGGAGGTGRAGQSDFIWPATGGAGGGRLRVTVPASHFGATVPVTVGAGGIPSATAEDAPAGSGGASSFGIFSVPGGGGGWSAAGYGRSSMPTPGGYAAPYIGGVPVMGLTTDQPGRVGSKGGSSILGAGAGGSEVGSGSGAGSDSVAHRGGAGGDSAAAAGGDGGTVNGTVGNPGGPGAASATEMGGGGGAGAGGVAATVGGRGGNGGLPGGGGGAGASAGMAPNTAGVGGTGARGEVRVYVICAGK